jgi:hypothetical protein
MYTQITSPQLKSLLNHLPVVEYGKGNYV